MFNVVCDIGVPLKLCTYTVQYIIRLVSFQRGLGWTSEKLRKYVPESFFEKPFIRSGETPRVKRINYHLIITYNNISDFSDFIFSPLQYRVG